MGARGPKPWEPTDVEVARIRLYAGLGSTQEQIASMIGKCVDTLVRDSRCRDALDVGKAETIAKVAGTLVKKALAGDTTSAIFYLKTQAGWRETIRNEHTGKDGGAIEMVDLSRLSPEELALYGRLSAKAEGLDPDLIVAIEK